MFLFVLCLFSGAGQKLWAQETLLEGKSPISTQAPVDFTADSLEHDKSGQVITAKGNVELVQAGYILKADKMTYNTGTDTVRAIGNVVLSHPEGDTYFADEFELKNQMKDGFVRGLHGLMADGSRFWAGEGERIAGMKIVMKEAAYTPCEPCKEDPSRPPVWQLRAGEVTHDKEEARIEYRDARFEAFGVPVAYTPYFAHPDGSVKRKSGFLVPSLVFDSYLGTGYAQEYYWDIAPDKDATIGALVSTDVNPVLNGEYRQRFENAEIKLNGSATYSDRTDRVSGREKAKDDSGRGHFFAVGRWEINEKWRSGLRVEVASDDQYMNQYDISNEDVLESEVNVERFSGRDYAVARVMAFQDIRISERQVDQPAVLPEVEARFLGDPNQALGGRWSLGVSALGLQRGTDDQDMTRGTLEGGWRRRFVHASGLVSRLDLTARGDAYNVRDRDVATVGSGRNGKSSALRGFAQGHLQSSYPVVKNFEEAQFVVEPLAALTMGTDVNVSDRIPNEDSQDVYLDSLKLFEPNRFPGYDRVEDRGRATYGLRTGLYGDQGYYGEIFFGQSRRFDKKNNPFPEGSGLSDQDSDYVGQLSLGLGDYANLDYSFQLENANLASQRHEVDLQTSTGPLSTSTQYFYVNALKGTSLSESREQVRTSAHLRLHKNWAVGGSVRYDLGEDEGLRAASYGIDYIGQCVTLSAIAERTLTSDSSGDSDTKIMFRLGLKNLGEFETSGVSLGQSDE